MSNKLQLNLGRGMVMVACLMGVLTSGFAQTDSEPKPAPRLPSIIFILADDLGYGDLGCYGQTQIKTRNIDRLAQEGMRFTSGYAGGPVGAPSRAALMTGRHTGHASIRGDGTVPLQPQEVTVAEMLKGARYRTGVIGLWGLGEQGSSGVPGKKGFDEWFGYLNQQEAHDYYPANLDRTGEGHDGRTEVTENSYGKKGKYSDDYFTEAALNFIKISKPDQVNHYRPFFLYLPYTIPHANNELGAETGNGMQVPNDAPYSGESWPQVEKNKAAMITRLDAYVGALMDQLKELKIDQNTIIIFSSGNGPHKEGGVDPKFFRSSGGLRGIKRDLYEGGIRVPLIVWWPRNIQAGTTSDLPCALWDFLPTAADMAQTDAPKDIDGISLLPTLLGRPQASRHEFLYWEAHEDGFKQAVRMGDWKAIRFGMEGPLELYNLKSDPGEKNNLADKNPEIVAKIEAYLKTARTEDANWPVKTTAETPKKEHGL